MSHNKIRVDKTCLNCGHLVEERFCTHCGQENLELHESVWSLVTHYVQDLFHYDNRVWHTLKLLLLKPGQVAREYMDGKRKQNLEPIRFYVLASSVFFLLLFFSLGSETMNTINTAENNYSKRLFHLKQEKEYRKGTPDTAIVNQLTQSLKEMMKIKDTTAVDSSIKQVIIDSLGLPPIDSLGTSPIDTTEEEEVWLERVVFDRLEARQDELEKEHEGDKQEVWAALGNELLHALPQLFFLSLPFFAFFLKVLYFRRPKNSYVEHFIFSLYYYSYLFVIMILFLLAGWLQERSVGEVFESSVSYATTALALYPFVYLLFSMKRFYNDRWVKLLFRYFILLFLLMVTFLVLFVLIAIVIYLW